MTAIVFLDTETTGLSLTDDVWEVAAIRREEDGRESEHHLFLQHDFLKCQSLPEPFKSDHERRFAPDGRAHTPEEAAAYLEPLLGDGRPHIVGAVPNFDTERLALLLRAHGFEPGWHYHLIDAENLAVGYLAGRGDNPASDVSGRLLSPPWDSNDLSRAVGVDPEQFHRHSAMGDVLWARAIYDRIMGAAEG